MTRGKNDLIRLLAGLAYDSGASAKARRAAEELYERAQYDLGAKILPLVRELHETRDIARFIARVSVWIAQPDPEDPGEPEDPDPQEPDEDTAVLWLMLAMPHLSRDRAAAAVRAAARYAGGNAAWPRPGSAEARLNEAGDALRGKIFACLEKQGPAREREIAGATGYPETVVRVQCRDLAGRGELWFDVASGEYSLAPVPGSSGRPGDPA